MNITTEMLLPAHKDVRIMPLRHINVCTQRRGSLFSSAWQMHKNWPTSKPCSSPTQDVVTAWVEISNNRTTRSKGTRCSCESKMCLQTRPRRGRTGTHLLPGPATPHDPFQLKLYRLLPLCLSLKLGPVFMKGQWRLHLSTSTGWTLVLRIRKQSFKELGCCLLLTLLKDPPRSEAVLSKPDP